MAGVPQLVQMVERWTTGAWSALLKAVAEVCPEVGASRWMVGMLLIVSPMLTTIVLIVPPMLTTIVLIVSEMLTFHPPPPTQVESILFADNHLRTLYPLVALPEMIPDVVNLSFANNQLQQVSTMDTCLRKLTKLREIVLTGNPIAELPKKNGTVAEYRQYVLISGVGGGWT